MIPYAVEFYRAMEFIIQSSQGRTMLHVCSYLWKVWGLWLVRVEQTECLVHFSSKPTFTNFGPQGATFKPWFIKIDLILSLVHYQNYTFHCTVLVAELGIAGNEWYLGFHPWCLGSGFQSNVCVGHAPTKAIVSKPLDNHGVESRSVSQNPHHCIGIGPFAVHLKCDTVHV